jgi:hypothetical protein
VVFHPATRCSENLSKSISFLIQQCHRFRSGFPTRQQYLNRAVFCFQQRGAKLLEEIRQAFRGEGLGDLMNRVYEKSDLIRAVDCMRFWTFGRNKV